MERCFILFIMEHFYRNARTYFSKNQQIRTDVKWKKEDNLRNQKLSPDA